MELLFLVIYYIFVCVISGIAGSGEGLRIKGVGSNSIVWHNQQWIERVGLFLSGAFAMAWSISNFISFVNLIMTLLVISATSGLLFFIWYDGIINKKLNYKFFRVSPTSKAVTEKFAYWYIKLTLLLILFGLHFTI